MGKKTTKQALLSVVTPICVQQVGKHLRIPEIPLQAGNSHPSHTALTLKPLVERSLLPLYLHKERTHPQQGGTHPEASGRGRFFPSPVTAPPPPAPPAAPPAPPVPAPAAVPLPPPLFTSSFTEAAAGPSSTEGASPSASLSSCRVSGSSSSCGEAVRGQQRHQNAK
ncbi:unnamed protein product [Closterium sp. NIES-53]